MHMLMRFVMHMQLRDYVLRELDSDLDGNVTREEAEAFIKERVGK